MDLELAGKCALITGASKGIGLAAAESLVAEGAEVVLVARDADLLEREAARLRGAGGTVDVLPADLSTTAGIDDVAGNAGEIDILVNNAGAIPPGRLDQVDSEQWRRAWDLKVFGFIDLTRALYDGLRERQGVVVNVIGAAGETFPPGYIAGAAGNAALMAFTKALAAQAATEGVRVVAISPGPVTTDRMVTMQRSIAAEKLGDPERWPELLERMAYGRAATPREIADAVAFLASPRSAYTNGAILTINGGV